MYFLEPPPLTSRKKLLKWTISVLRKYGIRPRKKLSQSFVVDPLLIREVIGLAKKYCSRRTIVEIGCGLGALTYYLAKDTSGRVLGIEVDNKFFSVLKDLLNGSKNILLIHGDGLKTSIYGSKCIVSNTPYHISSDLIVSIARDNFVEKAVLVLQKEVVDRLLARPGSKSYGRLTVLVQSLFRVYSGGVYSPASFHPSPEVYSRVVVLERISSYSSVHEVLEEVTRVLFSMRRRRAYTVLSKKLCIEESVLASILGDSIDRRVYELEPRVLMEIARFLVERKCS